MKSLMSTAVENGKSSRIVLGGRGEICALSFWLIFKKIDAVCLVNRKEWLQYANWEVRYIVACHGHGQYQRSALNSV